MRVLGLVAVQADCWCHRASSGKRASLRCQWSESIPDRTVFPIGLTPSNQVTEIRSLVPSQRMSPRFLNRAECMVGVRRSSHLVG